MAERKYYEEWIMDKCPELLEDCEDQDRGMDELIALLESNYHWENALVNMSAPGARKFLISVREQLITWLNTEPEDRTYPSPLSEKQLYVTHDYRGFYPRRRV